ncbi:GNAT family N-acetyltransferase [Demequina sp. NBRC 110052]|uniref:GNAT family N-acetyltransferase n=1 Tax=Demequina sp. NBRC 110052 TaxID=1570341 RepID=UPI000A0757FC|nr:GNAT family N-acetyltransferase [Demequina sp. NBRC 110052]
MHVVPVVTEQQFEEALALRIAVFVDEQGVDPDSERDDIDDDPRTLHALCYADTGALLGVGRLVAPGTDTAHGAGAGLGAMSPDVPHIGRVAVGIEGRGAGAGTALMAFLEAEALARFGEEGAVRVELSAQDQAMPFYARLGYETFGEGYLDEGIGHHDAFKIVRAPHTP